MIDCTAGEGENLVHTLAAPFLACPPKSVGGRKGEIYLLASLLLEFSHTW